MAPENPSTPQFYKQIVALSEKAHADWKVRASEDYTFAAGTNAIVITAVEFLMASKEYPIVFVRNNETYHPVVIVGLKQGQNLFTGTDKGWKADYIPAYVRRYPFILAGELGKSGGNFTVCIDEGFAGFNRKEGQALFSQADEQSDYLKQVINFLQDYHRQGQLTEQFCKQLAKLDLFEPMQANIVPAKGEELSVAGFNVISRDKLKKLKPLELAELVKTDAMELIYLHFASLPNFNRLTRLYTENKLAQAS